MDLTPSPIQEHLLSEISAFVKEQLPLKRLHGDIAAESAHLRAFGELGWLGMSLPETLGGAGFCLADEALLCRELGRALGPVSLLAAALAARIAHAADRPCPLDILSGEAVVAIACPTAAVNIAQPNAQMRLFANGAPSYAVLVSAHGCALLQISRDADLRPLPCLEPSVTMLEASLSTEALVVRAEGDALWAGVLTLIAATTVGMAEGARDLIAEYAKVRQTFGRPIGAYQAVRHPIAEMAARCEQAYTQTMFAALTAENARPDAVSHAIAARFLAQQAATKNADGCIQLHGGIGVTDEYDAHQIGRASCRERV